MPERKKALFVGNDINNVVPGYSWSDLLDELIRFVKAEAGTRRGSLKLPSFPPPIGVEGKLRRESSQ